VFRPRKLVDSRYQLDQAWYSRADKRVGRPGIIGGDDLTTGDRILLKQWAMDLHNAKELRELWAHEIRQLHSLAGTAEASEMIVPIIESGEDQDSFYLILRLGRRSPLKELLNSAPKSNWLTAIRLNKSRTLLWSNVKRLAMGLNILHSQGILHRRLDEMAVFTDGGDEPDFQLGGFEWSLRLIDVEAKKTRQRFIHPLREYYSFIDDWRDLGTLACNLLGIKLTPTKQRFDQDISFLESEERALLRRLIQASSYHDVDQEGIFRLLDDAIDASDSSISHGSNQLVLACNLSTQSKLSKAVVKSTDGLVSLEDFDGQLEFIEADISANPILIERKVQGRPLQLMIQGENLTYHLKKFHFRKGANSTWDLAYCDTNTRYQVSPSQINRRRPINSNIVKVLKHSDAIHRAKILRNISRRWDQYLSATDQSRVVSTDQEKFHAALVLLLLLESEIQRAAILPVSIENREDVDAEVHEIYVRPRRDDLRSNLAVSLGLKSNAERMRKLFEDGDVDFDSEWILSNSDVANDANTEKSQWKFVGVKKAKGGAPLYRFKGDGEIPLGDDLFIYASNIEGTDRLLRRHGKALSALRDHSELLGVLNHPRQYVRKTNDEVIENSTFKALDEVKQDVLRKSFKTLPVFLVQGPPGVGKTKLVSALAKQQFGIHSSSRLLLTAQSHQAVDHLMEKVSEEIGNADDEIDLLIVRCKPKDSNEKAYEQPFDLRVQTRKVVQDFAQSPLVDQLPKVLRSAVEYVCLNLSGAGESDERQTTPPAVRAIESLVLRSSNLVFSTTNAVELERLVEEHAHFDLSVIEEAAKATGVELVSPLMLSHKRFAIGDHKQLPPFGADNREALLTNPIALKSALTAGWTMVASSFRAVGLDDVVEWVLGLPEGEFSEVSSIASSALNLFQSLVEVEFERSKSDSSPIAQKLTIQHRMHPAIASLVSSTFYSNDLHTHKDAESRFVKRPPVISRDSKLFPGAPIVFVDVPYVQSDIGVEKAELLPLYHNPREVNLVINVLENIVVHDDECDTPTLAILSPYKEQVNRIIEALSNRKELLSQFEPNGRNARQRVHIGTVDSFQGSEADVVIVSFVRNNERPGMRGLGFLRDPRRMNVLLSRAKWKLVIVGSLEYLEHCVTSTGLQSTMGEAYLPRFIENFRRLELEKLDEDFFKAVRIRAQELENRSGTE